MYVRVRAQLKLKQNNFTLLEETNISSSANIIINTGKLKIHDLVIIVADLTFRLSGEKNYFGRRVIGISGSLIWSKTLMELIFSPCGEFR